MPFTPLAGGFLSEAEIEKILKKHPKFEKFWQQLNHVLIFRSPPTQQDPIWEVQLAWEMGDRLESYGWVWLEALEGKILLWHPE